MPKLTIDHLQVEVPKGTKVIEAAEKLGIMIPRFCYHTALGSVGACRLCAVMFLEGPVKGLEMSCMTDAKDGMVVSTTHPEAQAFRKYVIEWLMMNHPLDCPVCDEGGHCLLQDETVSGSHSIRRYPGPKRTYRDQYLGAFVQHEMNRCIQCFRCRRFYQEFAGYRDLGAMQIGNRTYFGRFADGALESPFAGNIIDVCPTGVFTDKPSRYKGRRWHYERGPTLCLHCSLGCNLTGSAYLRRMLVVEARLNEKVNGYFICDRGRYGFFYANHSERPWQPRLNDNEVDRQEALKVAATKLTAIRQNYGPGAIACVGSSRSSLETQGALAYFCRSQDYPPPQFFWNPSQEGKVRAAVSRLDERLAVSLRQIERADFVIVAGADPVNEAPMLALALRQAARSGAPVVVLDPRPITLPLDFYHLPLRPAAIGPALGFLTKLAVPPDAAAQSGGKAWDFYQQLPEDFSGWGEMSGRLRDLGAKLQEAKNPVVVCGLEVAAASTIHLAADLALFLKQAGKGAGLFYLLPGPNAFGAALLAAASPASPGLWPWGPEEPATATGAMQPASSGLEIIEGLERGAIKALVLVENDPFWDFPDGPRLAQALANLEFLLVLDYLPSPAVGRAHVFLPTAAVFERGASSFVNQEGRVQLAPPVHTGGIPIPQISPEKHPPREILNYIPGQDARAAALVLADLSRALGGAWQGEKPWPLWDYLGKLNPALAEISSLPEQPEGVRLLPQERSETDFATAYNWQGAPEGEQLELLLVEATFGTEELASYSEFIRMVEEPPKLTLHPDTAKQLGLAAGDRVALALPGGELKLELRLAATMAPGIALLPRHRALDWRKLPTTPFSLAAGAITRAEG